MLHQNTKRKRFIEHSDIYPVNSYNEVKMSSLYYLYWLQRCGVAQSHIQETFSSVRSWLQTIFRKMVPCLSHLAPCFYLPLHLPLCIRLPL